MKYIIKVYRSQTGRCPFTKWLEDLDWKSQDLINMRLHRMSIGNFGNCKTLGQGVSELKLDVGPGYRIYFSKIGSTIVLVLCAGAKHTQSRDIEKAKKYLMDFEMRGGLNDN